MAAPGDEPEAALYVVAVTGAGDADAALLELDSIALSPTLFLVRSDLSQSRLYHLVKRRAGAETLFVGRLDGPPKFMGMSPGSLATLRSWDVPG